MPEIEIKNFAGGLNTRESSDHINDNELQDSLNYLLSQKGTLEPRLGYAKITEHDLPSYDHKGVWCRLHTDGTEQIVVRAGDHLYWKSGSDAWTEILVTATKKFSTGTLETTKSFTYTHHPIASTTWILTNATAGTQSAHEAGGAIVADGGSGVGGTINISTGAVALTGLTQLTNYSVVFTASTAFATGGDRTSGVNYRGSLYLADGYNFIKWDGTTGSDVDVGDLDYILPYYLWVHDNRLWGGNLRMWNGSSYTAYPCSISWCQPQYDTQWTPPGDGSYNRIDFESDVTGGVSFGHNLIFTRRQIYLGIDDTALMGSYYYPSIKVHAPTGALPFTMQVCDQDVWFANEHGVYSISKTQAFGDLEKNRISYKIDPIFKTGMSTSLTMNSIYVPWRDEYWLSYLVSGSAYKVLVGKRSLYDEWGRPPWMTLNMSSRNWAIKNTTQDIVFTAVAGTYKLWLYGGYSDNGAAINMYAQTKEYLSENRNRKRLNWITLHRKRMGTLSTSETSDFTINEKTYPLPLKTYTPLFDSMPSAVYYWSTSQLWGSHVWTAPTMFVQEVNSDKYRISKYARSFNVKFAHTSTLSGVAPMHLTVAYQESAR